MAPQIWTLTDQARQSYIAELDVDAQQVPGSAAGYRVAKRRLQGGPADGVDVIHVDNGSLRFDLLPSRGMGIWKAWLGDQQIGWNSPVPGPVHPSLVPLADPSGLGWLDGFDELLVRCGLESNGAPEFDQHGQLVYGLHGRIANKPAHFVQLSIDGDTGEITVTGVVDEIRFHFFKLRLTTTIKTQVGQNKIAICDQVQNLSASPTDIQMLYHINLGPPLLEPQSQVVAAVKTVAPRDAVASPDVARWHQFGEPRPGAAEQVYFFELAADDQQRTAVLLKNAESDRAVRIAYRTDQLPCFTLWKNEIATPDGFVTGLEPATNFPNYRSFEKQQGRVVTLPPGGSCTFDVSLEALADPTEVEAAEASIQALAPPTPHVASAPLGNWSAGA